MTTTQNWLISGGSRGLGAALVSLALNAGHRVFACSRSGAASGSHDNLHPVKLDVADRAACASAVEGITRAHGPIDVLINNAGYGLVGATEEVSEEQARAIIDVDLLGPLWLTQAVLPGMRAAGHGHIIQVSSTGGVGAMPFLGLYNAAKWGLEGFSEALAGEVRAFGVKVTLAEIGSMDTHWGTSGMRFATPLVAYDAARTATLGSSEVPWAFEPGATSGGASVTTIAHALMRHLCADNETPFRLLLGADAPAQVASVLESRIQDYRKNPDFPL